MLTDEQFDRTRRLALRLAGIHLFERHRELLGRKGRRLGITDPANFEALLHAAESGDPRAGRQVIGLLTTNFTGFFRHPWHFDIAGEHALLVAHGNGVARLWSAAAATGEEPYSLAMALIEVFGCDDPPASILASDVDTDALAKAIRGEYDERALLPAGARDGFISGNEASASGIRARSSHTGGSEKGEMSGLSPERRANFLNRTEGGRWSVTPPVRRLVEFCEVNLAEVSWPVEGPFDVIFCRNVLMYLEAGHRQAVLERMASLLAPDGLLMLDLTEYPGRGEKWFSEVAPGVYERRSYSGHAAATISSLRKL